MVVWLLLIVSFLFGDPIIGGLSDHNVIVINQTGLHIARLKIDQLKIESIGGNVSDKLLIEVTPAKHNIEVVFRGGAEVKWLHFDFNGIHEIILQHAGKGFQINTE